MLFCYVMPVCIYTKPHAFTSQKTVVLISMLKESQIQILISNLAWNVSSCIIMKHTWNESSWWYSHKSNAPAFHYKILGKKYLNHKMKCGTYIVQYSEHCQIYDHFTQVIDMFVLFLRLHELITTNMASKMCWWTWCSETSKHIWQCC
jgi:hypothetical protein